MNSKKILTIINVLLIVIIIGFTTYFIYQKTIIKNEVSNQSIVIEKGETHSLNGVYNDIKIDTNDSIKLVLDNVTVLKNINIVNSKDIEIELKKGTINIVNEGILSEKDLIISGEGKLVIYALKDGINVNGKLTINNGVFNITSGDDGIHSDKSITINNGVINILDSYEGIEGSSITINNGEINIKSLDDGINASKGKDKSSKGKITINGGDIHIDSNGDGIDSNGSIYLNGGNLLVKGSSDNKNAPIDYDKEFIIEGGSLLALGSIEKSQIPSSSKINSINIYLELPLNSNITIKDLKGNNIISEDITKSYSLIMIVDNKLVKGQTYKLFIDNKEFKSFKIKSNITTLK